MKYLSSNLCLCVSLVSNLHQRDTEPDLTNHRTCKSSKSCEAGLRAADTKQALLLTSFIISKETMVSPRSFSTQLFFFFFQSKSNGTKSKHMVCLSGWWEMKWSLSTYREISLIFPLKLLTSHHQHVFSIVGKRPLYCLWLARSKAALKEPSERLTFLTCWNNDATARRRAKASMRLTPSPWPVPNLEM